MTKMIVLLLALCMSVSPAFASKKFGRNHTGLKIPKHWEKTADFVNAPEPDVYPFFFDWRNQIPNIPQIVSQGNCGSCWAFGTTAVLNWAHAIKTGEVVDLSEQEILSCSREGTCNGGYFAHKYQVSPGQSIETEFPYTAKDLKCKSGLSHRVRLNSWAYVGSKGRKPTTLEIKAAIMAYGPVAVTVTANNAMSNFKGPGVFKGCSNGQTNHIVHIVGWDDEKGSWIMGNSWGKNWGDQGYALIPYGCSRIAEITTYVRY